jgi:hypothetical protein
MAVNEGMTSIFIPDTTFGFGSIKRVGDTIKLLGCSKPVIITDDGIVNAGLLKPIEQSLKHADIPYAVFSKCLPNAPLTAINECLKIVRNGKYDVVIAVGGGSVIDTAKVVSVGATETKPVTEYISSETIKSSALKKYTFPSPQPELHRNGQRQLSSLMISISNTPVKKRIPLHAFQTRRRIHRSADDTEPSSENNNRYRHRRFKPWHRGIYHS